MTKMGMRRTEPQKPLKRYTPLRAKKQLSSMSKKTKKELATWALVKTERIQKLREKYGYTPCEYCLKPIQSGSDLFCAEGHHNNHDRRQNEFENCRILHRVCNQRIEDLNVRDVPSLL